MEEPELNALSREVMDAAYKVQTLLGIGLFEAAYKASLKLAHKRLGPLINFNVPLLREGINRRVDRLQCRTQWTRCSTQWTACHRGHLAKHRDHCVLLLCFRES